MMLDACSVLQQLLDCGERVLRRNVGIDPHLQDLALAVEEPGADLVGIGDEARMLVKVLRHITPSDDPRWRIIAFDLMELVGAALKRALADRLAAASRPDPEAQPNYRGGRA